MGGSDSKIETSNISESLLRAVDPLPPPKYVPPFRKFGEIQPKRTGPTKTYQVSVKEPFEEKITLSTTVFEEMQRAFHAKTEEVVVEGVITDDQVSERWVFQTTAAGNRNSLLIRPFSSDDTHMYANIICEVHFAEAATALHSPFLLALQDNYVVPTGIEMEEPNSHVLVMEAVDANLAQVLKYRRSNKWDWGVQQFQRLMHDLVGALDDLHRADISHNDIRPGSVFFSVQKNAYVLGNYANCQKGEANTAFTGARPDQLFSAPEAAHQHEVNLLKGDVYSLGLTLLSAFYLCPHVDRKLFVVQNKLLEGRYEALKVIEKMLLPVEQRPTIAEVRASLPASDFKYDSMGKLVESMRHKSRSSPDESAAEKLAAAWAYQRLGLWNEWKKEYEAALELKQHTTTLPERAASLQQLAVIDYCRGELESSTNYAKSAAGIYRQLGNEELSVGVFGAAESYFKKAIGCSKYYEFEHDIDLSRSLQGLSRVHAERNQYKLARTLAATSSMVASKSPGNDTFELANIRIQEAKLQTDFGAFESADAILKECLSVAQSKKDINSAKARELKARVLAERGRNSIKRAEKQTKDQRSKSLEAANADLTQASNIFSQMDEDRYNDLAYIVRLLGQVQFKLEAYDEAIKDYDSALSLINHVELSEKRRTKERGELLCLKGTAQSFKGNTQEALACYQSALDAYRNIYGSDHNRASALAIGNLGSVYAKSGEVEKARDCLRVCRDILADIAGQYDADYLHFKEEEENLHKLIPDRQF